MDDAALAALNAPSAVSNAKITADRRKANRFLDSGYVVDADADPEAAVLLPAGRQVAFDCRVSCYLRCLLMVSRLLQGIRSMYTLAKSVAREKMRLAPALVSPIQRLWRVATNVRDLSTAFSDGKLSHEACDVYLTWCVTWSHFVCTHRLPFGKHHHPCHPPPPSPNQSTSISLHACSSACITRSMRKWTFDCSMPYRVRNRSDSGRSKQRLSNWTTS
jgi:hypothetical protein